MQILQSVLVDCCELGENVSRFEAFSLKGLVTSKLKITWLQHWAAMQYFILSAHGLYTFLDKYLESFLIGLAFYSKYIQTSCPDRLELVTDIITFLVYTQDTDTDITNVTFMPLCCVNYF